MRRVFGEIQNNEMILNQWGLIAQRQWEWLFQQYTYIAIDQYIIMPDHIHGIIHINDIARGVGNGRDRSLHPEKIKSIPELIGAFKTTSSKAIHLSGNPDFKWKKSYYDRIIRNAEELYRIRRYIENNIVLGHEKSQEN
jgi:REP element-mobilizing transposase RayT